MRAAAIFAKIVVGAGVTKGEVYMDRFKLTNECSVSDLISYGFKKVGADYKMSVPLYTYNKQPVIVGVLHVDFLDEYLRIEIRNSSGSLYGAYYDREFSNPNKNRVLKIVNGKINAEIKKMRDKKIIQEWINNATDCSI